MVYLYFILIVWNVLGIFWCLAAGTEEHADYKQFYPKKIRIEIWLYKLMFFAPSYFFVKFIVIPLCKPIVRLWKRTIE